MLRHALVLAALAAALAVAVQASGGSTCSAPRRVGALALPVRASPRPPIALLQGRKLSQEGELLQAMTGALAPAAPLLDAPGPAPALPPAMADG